MISIITAIYNQLPMNKLYYESLQHATDGDYELIIVDNGSTDGSVEFFESLGDHVRVIRNDGNYSYPYCQNVGIRHAKGEVFAFFNNDILLSPHWDTRLMQILGHDGHEIMSLCSNQRMATQALTKQMEHRWKHIKNPILFLFGAGERSLRMMARLMYGASFDTWCDRLWEHYGTQTRIGFAGSAVVMTKTGLDMIGGQWDPQQQGADYDLYLQTKRLQQEGHPIQTMCVVCGVYHHHFCRLTFHTKFPPYKDASNLSSCEEKWGEDVLKQAIKELRQ